MNGKESEKTESPAGPALVDYRQLADPVTLKRLQEQFRLQRVRRVVAQWRDLSRCKYIVLPTDYDSLTQLARKILSRSVAGKRNHAQLRILKQWLRLCDAQKTKPQLVRISHLSDDLLTELAQFMTISCYDMEELIFLQTEAGSSFYIILSGQVDIYDVFLPRIDVALQESFQKYRLQSELSFTMKQPVVSRDHPARLLGAQVVKSSYLSSLFPGTYFGEVALVSEDALRTATAVTVKPTALLTIPKQLFQRTLRDFFSDSLEFETKRAFLKSLDLFASWDRGQLNNLTYWLETDSAPRGSVILPWNSRGNRMIILRRGMVKVMGLDSFERPIEFSLGSPGTVFGEGSLLESEGRRQYFVEASSEVEFLVLPESSFKKFLRFAKCTSTFASLQSLWQERKRFYESRAKQISSVFHDPTSGEDSDGLVDSPGISSFVSSETSSTRRRMTSQSPMVHSMLSLHLSPPRTPPMARSALGNSPMSPSQSVSASSSSPAPSTPLGTHRQGRMALGRPSGQLKKRPPQGDFWNKGDTDQIFHRRPLALVGAQIMLSPIHGDRVEAERDRSTGGTQLNQILCSLNKFCTMRDSAVIWSPSQMRLSKHR